jgi:hypothetical protein
LKIGSQFLPELASNHDPPTYISYTNWSLQLFLLR